MVEEVGSSLHYAIKFFFHTGAAFTPCCVYTTFFSMCHFFRFHSSGGFSANICRGAQSGL